MWLLKMKANFIGIAFLTFLIVSFFLLIYFIFSDAKVGPLFFPLYIAWCAIALYIWSSKFAINSFKEWSFIALFSVLWAAFWVLITYAELYITTRSIVIHMNFSIFISILAAAIGCPGLTFIALAGCVRELFIKPHIYLNR